MDKKRNSKSVVLTIIVTVIVLAVLTVMGVRVLIPNYVQGQGKDVDVQYTIYQYAIRIFPLLIGIVLIVIASMIAGGKDDEEDEDEDDLLPPNSYDAQMFEVPSDDPVRRPAARPDASPAPEPEKPEVLSSDSISDDDFFAIFNDREEEKKEEKKEEPVAKVIEEVKPVEPEKSEEPAEPAEAEEETPAVEETPSEEEPEAVSEVVPETPVQEVRPVAESSATDRALVDAVYALVNKLDEMADLITYQDDEDFEDEEEDEEDFVEEQPEGDYAALERKVDKLCDAVAKLTEIVSGNVIVKPQTESPAPAPVQEVEPVAETVEVPEEQKQINDYDFTNPLHLMRIEFDSAQEDTYDITFAFTDASAESIRLQMSEIADAYSVDGKTVVVIPFLSDEEAQTELDREGVERESVFIAAGEKADFDDVVMSRLS